MALAFKPTAQAGTLDDLIAETLRIIREEGEPIRDAVPRVLEAWYPDDEATHELIRVGLVSVVNARINSGWTGEADEAEAGRVTDNGCGRTGSARPSRIDLAARAIAAMRRNYEGADGRRKPLADFTLADCVFLSTASEARAHGLTMLAKAMKVAAAYLRDGTFTTIGSLPEDKRQKVGQYVVRAPEGKE